MLRGLRLISATDRAYDSCALALSPPPSITVSEWADENRVLTTGESGIPGPWRTSRVPYAREIMDRLSPHDPCERVVWMKGAQIAATESGNNWIGYVVHHTPGPMLIVQPTVEAGKRFSKQRLSRLIENSPELKARVKDARSRDSGNTVLMKEFPGGVMIITGANSAVGLRSMPARFIFLDEVDAYPHDADGEGDPVELAIGRTTGPFIDTRKIFMVSTPKIKDHSRIEAAYLSTDQRRYYVPCPECGEMQTIEWKRIKWQTGDRAGAYLECEFCGAVIEHEQKEKMLAAGEWRATAEGLPRTHGYHLSSLYSPWLKWGDIAVEHGKVHKDPVRLKTWVNTKLGETWDESDGDTIDGHELLVRCEDWGQAAPAAVMLITAGVDVQDDRIEVEVVGWGAAEESWSLKLVYLYGDPSGSQVWEDLDAVLLELVPVEDEPAGRPIDAACIDTGGHHTLAAYRFCKARGKRRVWAIKGKGGQGYNLWPRRPSRNNKGKVNLYTIGVDSAKEQIYARLRIDEPGPGYCHFPMERTSDYFEQLTCEVRRTKYVKGRPVKYWWKKDGHRNEGLDLRVYALAGLHGLYSQGKSLKRRLDTQRRGPDPSGKDKRRPRRKSWLKGEGRSGWLK